MKSLILKIVVKTTRTFHNYPCYHCYLPYFAFPVIVLQTSSVMNMKILFGFLVAFILISSQAISQTDLSTDEFEKSSGKENIQILDVRTQAEYNSGHIKNAFLVDWTQRDVFEERIKYLDKNKPVYAYCLVGGRSSAAATRLK